MSDIWTLKKDFPLCPKILLPTVLIFTSLRWLTVVSEMTSEREPDSPQALNADTGVGVVQGSQSRMWKGCAPSQLYLLINQERLPGP